MRLIQARGREPAVGLVEEDRGQHRRCPREPGQRPGKAVADAHEEEDAGRPAGYAHEGEGVALQGRDVAAALPSIFYYLKPSDCETKGYVEHTLAATAKKSVGKGLFKSTPRY